MRLEDLQGRATLTVPETAELLGVSRDVVYEQIRQGAIPCLPLGRRKLVPVPALKRMLGVEDGQEERAGPVQSEADPKAIGSAGLKSVGS